MNYFTGRRFNYHGKGKLLFLGPYLNYFFYSHTCLPFRYNEAVNKAARRMLPALSRSFFSASVNVQDVAAAEVRSLFRRAWLSRTSDLYDDPLKGNDMALGSGLDGAAATSAASTGLPGTVAQTSGGAVQVPLRPWHVAKELLKMHILACKVREKAEIDT